jgi:hypothetical protein
VSRREETAQPAERQGSALASNASERPNRVRYRVFGGGIAEQIPGVEPVVVVAGAVRERYPERRTVRRSTHGQLTPAGRY